MNMNLSKKLIILILSGLILVALIIYFIFIYDFNKTETPESPTGQQTPAEIISKSPEPVPVVTRTTENIFHDQAAQLALSFTERYGSSSSQSDFSNLSDLELFMTDTMITKTRAFIATEREKNPGNEDYTGITTKAITTTFNSYDAVAGTADITVSTKRQEQSTAMEVKSYDQKIKLTMKKINDEWRVDSAIWQ
jgi:hypothetical protein